jgi:hypothetical protein
MKLLTARFEALTVVTKKIQVFWYMGKPQEGNAEDEGRGSKLLHNCSNYMPIYLANSTLFSAL